MKKIYILMIILFIGLYSSAFTVKDSGVAIVTNSYNNSRQMYTTGMYLTLPFIQQVNYVEVNQRSSVFVIPFTINSVNNLTDTQESVTNDHNYQIKTLISWHITQPIIYFEYMQKKSDTGISKILAINVESSVITQLKQITDATKLNQLQNILNAPLFLSTIGGVMDNLSIINITKITNATESALQNNIPDNIPAIESAYYFAQKTKDQTSMAEINLYHQIENKNPRFYEYFRALELYKTNAKSKSELPPLTQLYK